MELIQNKYEPKKLLDEKVFQFLHYKVKTQHDLASFGFPVVQKAKLGGYGWTRCSSIKKSRRCKTKAIKTESFIEEMVDIDKN